MPSQRDILTLSSAIATLGSFLLTPAATRGLGGPAANSGAQAINSSVFDGEPIKAVTAVTEVFTNQRTTAAIFENDTAIGNGMVHADQWTVTGGTITRAYANDRAKKEADGRGGRFVVLELNPKDESAVTFLSDVEEPTMAVTSQLETVRVVFRETYAPTTTIINTRQVILVVDDFQQLRFADSETRLLLTYKLCVPKDYDQSKSYPLVLFMHDAGVTGTNPLRTLQHGLGAISFASLKDQAKHPAFVVAPQYPVTIANDALQTSDYAEEIRDLATRYGIDESHSIRSDRATA